MAQPQQQQDDSGTLSIQQTLSIYLPAFVLSLGTGIIAPVLPVYVKSFDISFAVASLAIILYQGGGMAITFPAGYLLDRLGRRPILLTGPIVLALSSALIAFSQDFTQVLVLRFIGGAAEQMWMLSRLAVITDLAGSRERGRQITWMTGLGRAGMLMGPAVGGFLAAGFDIRIPFIIFGVMVFLSILPSFWLIQETNPARFAQEGPAAQPGQRAQSDWGMVIGELLKFQMLVFLLAQFCANIARIGFQGGSVIFYAAYAYGVGPAVLGLLGTAAGVVSLPITFATGPIMDRFGRKKIIVPGFFLTGSMGVLLAATTVGPVPFILFAVVYTASLASMSMTSGTMQVLGSDLAPARARGRFFAIWRFVAMLAATIGPALVAVLSERFNFAVAFGAIGLSGLIVAFVVGVVLRETLQERPAAKAAT